MLQKEFQEFGLRREQGKLGSCQTGIYSDSPDFFLNQAQRTGNIPHSSAIMDIVPDNESLMGLGVEVAFLTSGPSKSSPPWPGRLISILASLGL